MEDGTGGPDPVDESVRRPRITALDGLRGLAVMARVEDHKGHDAEAETLYREALAVREGTHLDRHDDPSEVRAHFAALLRRMERNAEADEQDKAIKDIKVEGTSRTR